jgi:hypothetical protein
MPLLGWNSTSYLPGASPERVYSPFGLVSAHSAPDCGAQTSTPATGAFAGAPVTVPAMRPPSASRASIPAVVAPSVAVTAVSSEGEGWPS